MVKHTYRQWLFRRDADLEDGDEHKAFIQEVLAAVKARIDVHRVMQANERYIRELLARRDRP